MTNRRPVLVPASRVFTPFAPRTPADQADHPPLGGSAAGSTLPEAVLGAALEVVERDGFLIAWANRLALPRLELTHSSPDGVGAYVTAFEKSGVEVRCALLTLDHGLPVVIAMARAARPGDPAMVVAAGSGLDPAAACRHALGELSANRLHVRRTMSEAHRLPEASAEEVCDETAHGLLYARPDMSVHLEHWWEPASTVALAPSSPPRSGADGVRLVVDSLAAVGLELVVVDITPPEIRDLGLSVARVLVPGAYPMSFDSRWPHLGGGRLRAAPVRAGLLRSPTPFGALNRLPHPFP